MLNYELIKGNSCKLTNKNDAKDFNSLTSAIEILGFDNSEQDTIFKILSAVLHLGNIYFKQVSILFLF